MIKIAIGSDHAGVDYKKSIVSYLEDKGYEVTDFGPYSHDSVDYPDYVHPVAKGVHEHRYERGIVLCGSGNGVAITANKYPGVRAGLAWTTELAVLTRQHNDANIISIPARFTSEGQALDIVAAFLNTAFEGGRHENRVKKIPCH